jgi:hypothetical protein
MNGAGVPRILACRNAQPKPGWPTRDRGRNREFESNPDALVH